MSGSKPGERRGGRERGVPNKVTQERQLKAAREIEAAMTGRAPRPLAIARLEELLDISIGAMRAHQQVTTEMVEKAAATGKKITESRGDWDKFGDWFDRAAYVAGKIMKTQTPELKAVMLAAAPNPAAREIAAQALGGNVVRLGSPVAASRAYQQLMHQPRQLALPAPAKRAG
jgi:hypothetical protein